MRVECPWCHQVFETDRYGRQFCTHCGAELDLPPPAPGQPPVPTQRAPGQQPQAWPGTGGEQQPSAWPGAGGEQQPPEERRPDEWTSPPAGGGGPPQPPSYSHQLSSGPYSSPGGGGAGGPPGGGWGGGGQGPPGYGAQPASPDGEPTAWERQSELGFFPALFQTWKEATFEPTAFFSRIRPTGIGPALTYALIVGTIGAVFGTLWTQLAEGFYGASPASLVVPLWANLIVAPFLFAIGLFISSAVIHVGCMVFGCANRGYEATFRAVAYSFGPAIFSIIPFCGSAVASIWAVIIQVIAIQQVQRTTGGRALGAVFLPAIVAFACICGIAATFGIAAGMLSSVAP